MSGTSSIDSPLARREPYMLWHCCSIDASARQAESTYIYMLRTSGELLIQYHTQLATSYRGTLVEPLINSQS